MSKVFVEYAIKSEFRDSFSHLYASTSAAGRAFGAVGGNRSGGTFVEIWKDVTYEEYLRMKKERLDEVAREALNEDLNEDLIANWEQWIQGGIRKLHMWHFGQVSS